MVFSLADGSGDVVMRARALESSGDNAIAAKPREPKGSYRSACTSLLTIGVESKAARKAIGSGVFAEESWS